MSTTILPRRGSAAAWTAANPILSVGERGYEIDTKRWKTGDGVTTWNAMPYEDASTLGLVQAAKNPDLLVTGAITLDGSNLITSAAVVWPDGSPGVLTITSRDANGAVLSYNITYGSPVSKTFSQPAITRNSAGAATNVPAIVVS